MIAPASDFNPQAFSMGVLLLLVCLLTQITIIHYAAYAFEVVHRRLLARRLALTGRSLSQLKFVLGAVVLVLIHLLHIYIWGFSLYLTGTVKAFSTAVIFAGSTYTTVGFTDDPLGAGWQLLAVTMAISGLFSFGLSTSVMFMLAQAVYPGRRPS